MRLEKEGIISPVKFSKWAAPIVPVVKKNGTVRICGDFIVTVNKALLTESYPLPRVDEVLSTLVTVNKALLTESYPLPRVDEVLSTLVTVNKALLTESYPLPRVDKVLSTLK